MSPVRPRPPGYVRWIVRTLEEAGFETWAVGGAVRNTLLGLDAGDWDLTTRAHPAQVRRLFPRTVPVGVEHGTVGVLTRGGTLVEVTTFRRDVVPKGRKAEVAFAETLAEDLSRRDFTINAIAWHPIREVFADPFDGRGDLEVRLLRTVGNPAERFREDYLRVLRALRFAGRFDLRVEEATWAALCEAVRGLHILSAERIREELMKVLGAPGRPSAALSLYAASGALDALYPELGALVGCPAPHRPGDDLWARSLLLADLLPARRPLLRLTALLHGVGVPEGTEPVTEGDPSARGARRAAAVLVRFRFSNAEVRRVSELVRAGVDPPLHLRSSPAVRRWLHRHGDAGLRDLVRLWLAGARLDRLRWGLDPGPVTALVDRLRREAQSDAPLRLGDLALDGSDLKAMGLRPGPRFGEILEHLMERVLEDPALNEPERLREIVRGYLEEEGSRE